MGIQVRPETREEFEKRCAETPADRLVGSAIIVTCDADHCTLEERAAINAIVRFRKTMKGEPHALTGQNHYTAFIELCEVADVLITTRAKKGETG